MKRQFNVGERMERVGGNGCKHCNTRTDQCIDACPTRTNWWTCMEGSLFCGLCSSLIRIGYLYRNIPKLPEWDELFDQEATVVSFNQPTVTHPVCKACATLRVLPGGLSAGVGGLVLEPAQ